METCKDCIHEKLCVIKAFPDAFENTEWSKKPCDHFKPTADVVPKSEVDKLIGKFECFLCHATGGRLSKHTYDLGTMESVATDCINETYNDGYGEGYKECASEIFEEIWEMFIPEKSATDCAYYFDMYELAELKKKYTEENK